MTAPLRTTVVTVASAGALIDLATVKDDLGIDDAATDDFLKRAIARVSGRVATYLGRSFAPDQVADTFVFASDDGCGEVEPDMGPLELARWPVVVLSSVAVAGMVLDPSLYVLDAGAGLLRRLGPGGTPVAWSPGPVVVAYTAGAVPPQLADVVSKLVASRYFARGRDPALRSEALPGVGSQTWAGGGTSSGMGMSGLPLDVEAMLDDLRDPVVA